jgi:hypothetical protein
MFIDFNSTPEISEIKSFPIFRLRQIWHKYTTTLSEENVKGEKMEE